MIASHRRAGVHALVRGRWIVVLAALLAPLTGGCAGGAQERAREVRPIPTAITACVARQGELRSDATLTRGAGRFHLTLVTVRDGAERSVTGTLELADNEPSLRRLPATGGAPTDDTVLLPLHGWAAIDLAAVDALEIGDIGSRDPLQPGVLVLEQRPAANAPVAITMRFGSLANRRHGPHAVDGGYMALHVAHITALGSFSGTWTSGVHARRTTGHFCAIPLP